MKRLILLIGVVCTVFSFALAADKAEAPQMAGRYVGTWKGPAETQGDLRITLKAEGTRWTAQAVFTFEGTEGLTKMKSVSVDGAKVVLVFDWTIDGKPGTSTLTGEWVEGKLTGTYRSETENPSSGTWSAAKVEE
jgi:opacity protein-like surface antigen